MTAVILARLSWERCVGSIFCSMTRPPALEVQGGSIVGPPTYLDRFPTLMSRISISTSVRDTTLVTCPPFFVWGLLWFIWKGGICQEWGLSNFESWTACQNYIWVGKLSLPWWTPQPFLGLPCLVLRIIIRFFVVGKKWAFTIKSHSLLPSEAHKNIAPLPPYP